jgi:hypothetical protein
LRFLCERDDRELAASAERRTTQQSFNGCLELLTFFDMLGHQYRPYRLAGSPPDVVDDNR